MEPENEVCKDEISQGCFGSPPPCLGLHRDPVAEAIQQLIEMMPLVALGGIVGDGQILGLLYNLQPPFSEGGDRAEGKVGVEPDTQKAVEFTGPLCYTGRESLRQSNTVHLSYFQRGNMSKAPLSELIYSNFSGMLLTWELYTEKYKAALISRPDTRASSFRVVSTPEGIILHGDLCPGRNGAISSYGYSMAWFGSYKSPGYLCTKFLTESFEPEVAVMQLQEILDEGAFPWDEGKISEEVKEVLKSLIQRADAGEINAVWEITEELGEAGVEVDDWTPGWAFNLRDVGVLMACQKKFKELYQEWAATQETNVSTHP